jgi:hypothetical protein
MQAAAGEGGDASFRASEAAALREDTLAVRKGVAPGERRSIR